MCNHSAPATIMRVTSADSLPKSEESTEGEMIGVGIFAEDGSQSASEDGEYECSGVSGGRV